jgi:7,8-dihydropterin-6-yl-methyl-4-(beta-D-ribofuranosyl)aminobenzene 5'-phosphate synthase
LAFVTKIAFTFAGMLLFWWFSGYNHFFTRKGKKQMRRISAVIIVSLTAVAVVLGATVFLSTCAERQGETMNEETEAVSKTGIKDLTITIVYDNNPYKQGLETAWGFSAFIAGPEKTILFDSGGDGSLLLSNMEKMEIEADSVDVVVLSHIHGDHTGGLVSFLKKNFDVAVYLSESFPTKFKDKVQDNGAKVVEVDQPIKICSNVHSTGQLGKWIKEQALIIRTEKGLIVITGCAHPGIVNIVNAAKDLVKEDMLLVMGGFHLEWAGKSKIEKIISSFKQLGVRYAGPCHCTGEKARSLFEEYFGKKYINVGAGRVITMADLQ